MMEYEEIRDRLETLTQQLAFVNASLSMSKSRLHDSIERTETVQQEASSLAHKFGQIAQDLAQAEQGIKHKSNKLAPVKRTSEQELFEEHN